MSDREIEDAPPSKVFVATDGYHVLGVYKTKERAQAACVEWAKDAEKREWHRHDGAWQMYYRFEDENWLVLRVTEDEVEE